MSYQPQPARQCQGTVKNKKWRDKYRCKCVGTVEIKGKRYCLTCARKRTEAAK